MNQTPLLSVCLITYNHEKYIREALDGIFMQEINFPMEVIIADDFSTDNTRNIILEYQKKFSHQIKLIFQEKNVGPAANWMDLMHSPKGKYIAYFEGDDYWTDSLKLQKQVDFLENNSDYSICFHNVEEVDNNGKTLDNRLVVSDAVEKTYTIEDLGKGNFIHSASVMFKKKDEEFPSWFLYSPAGDYPLHLMNASDGLIKYFPEKMATYRIGEGIWSSQTKVNQFINTICTIKIAQANLHLNNEVNKHLDNQILKLIHNVSNIVSPVNNSPIDPLKIAYNLSLKNLVIIILKKLRYYF